MIEHRRVLWIATIVALLAGRPTESPAQDETVLPQAQRVMAKVYGLGGVAGLEAYQTGFFLAGTPATVLTIDSVALEEAKATLVDAFGDRFEGRVVGRDASSGLALIACPESVTPPGELDLADVAEASIAQPVWVLSNAFGVAAGDEPVSVQRARIAVKSPIPLADDAAVYRPKVGVPRLGSPVLLFDRVTSNPGAGGGMAINAAGSLVGVLGAECRSPVTGAWINYALPAATVVEAIERMRSDERPTDSRRRDDVAGAVRGVMRRLGLTLIPAIGSRTPAYIEYVLPDGVADRAGCRPDDLIVSVNGRTVGAVGAAGLAIARGWQNTESVELSVLRNDRLIVISLNAIPGKGAAP